MIQTGIFSVDKLDVNIILLPKKTAYKEKFRKPKS